MRSLRFDGESDETFRTRAERAGALAHLFIEACLANKCVQEYLADPCLPLWTVERVRNHPTIRVEYEQAIGIGGLGETLLATQSKSWGTGPCVTPLESDDWFYPDRITYHFRENSVYNRRYEQRMRLKELLGKQHRELVSRAQSRYCPKSIFLTRLTDVERQAIRKLLRVEPGEFWRAVKGRTFLDLPPRRVQLGFDFLVDEQK